MDLDRAYRALAAAVITQAVTDAESSLKAVQKRPPRIRADTFRNTVAKYHYWTQQRRNIARCLSAHRFLCQDDSRWWELAGVSRETLQSRWRAQHARVIAGLMALEPGARRRAVKWAELYQTARRQRCAAAKAKALTIVDTSERLA